MVVLVDVCGYFFKCAFLVRGPLRGCRVINLFRSGGKKPGNQVATDGRTES